MQYVSALIAVTFIALALLHVPHPSPYLWLPYAAGAVLALLSLVPNLNVPFSRLLAITTTALMFFFFAGFFMGVPKLESDWYQSQEGWAAVSLLVAAFTLIPVLSDYSCRCKAECRQSRASRANRTDVGDLQNSFFSAPEHPRPRNS